VAILDLAQMCAQYATTIFLVQRSIETMVKLEAEDLVCRVGELLILFQMLDTCSGLPAVSIILFFIDNRFPCPKTR
jgi:hypothetical protein